MVTYRVYLVDTCSYELFILAADPEYPSTEVLMAGMNKVLDWFTWNNTRNTSQNLIIMALIV